jgi:flagellar hook-associated protein 2
VLGFTQPGRGGIAQIVQSANAFTDASGGASATSSTLLTNMQANGQLVGITAGDTITIGGTKGDGTAVSRTFTMLAGSTVQNLLDAVNDASSGFGAGTRTATASIASGRIAITDGTVGDSRLGISLAVNKASGGTVSFGAFTTGNGGTVGRSREITTGSDSSIRVEGQMVTRPTNTVSDAISGVTLNLLSSEAGTTVNVQVARNVDAITGNLNSFATAYNNLRSFITQNTAPRGPLAGNTAIRSMGSTINSQLLSTVVGLSGTYTSAALAGLQHDRNGVLSLDGTAFKAALASNFNDVKTLFSMTGTVTDSEVSYISAGSAAQPSAVGSPYAISVTQPSTLATISGAQWTTYVTAGAADTMSITDASSGLTGSIALANGDTLTQAVQRLNSMFSTQKLRLTAEATTDNRLKISASDYGTTGGFTAAYTAGAGGNGTGMLGITAQAYAGLDVAGTINGLAGSGKGQYLTGGSGDASESLIIRYTGTTARAAGTVAFSLGAGGVVERNAIALAASNTGSVAVQAATAKTQADNLQIRINDIQQRLDTRKATLTKQFIDMETAMSKAQAIGNQLTTQLNQLQQQSR